MLMIRNVLMPKREIGPPGEDLICPESNTPRFNTQLPPRIFLQVEGKEPNSPSLPSSFYAEPHSFCREAEDRLDDSSPLDRGGTSAFLRSTERTLQLSVKRTCQSPQSGLRPGWLRVRL
jgi:hypothetical protein